MAKLTQQFDVHRTIHVHEFRYVGAVADYERSIRQQESHMANSNSQGFVITVSWETKPGKENVVADLLRSFSASGATGAGQWQPE